MLIEKNIKSIKILLLFLNVILITAIVVAGQEDIEALKKKLESYRGKSRIPVLKELAGELQRKNPGETINYGNEALSLLRKYPDTEQEIEVLYFKGWAFIHLNETDSARACAIKIETKSIESEISKGLAWSYFLSARILRNEGIYEDASETLNKAIEESEKDYDAVLKAKLKNELGSVNRRLGNLDEALANHKEAFELLKDMVEENELVQTYTYLGISNDALGHYAEALKFHQLALQLHQKNSDTRGIAGSTHNLGILYQKIDQYDKALEYYNQAIIYWKELGEENNLASTLNSIGAVNELQEKYSSALSYYQQALAIWEKSGSKFATSIGFHNIGSIYSSLGNYSKALENLNKAIQIRKNLGDSHGTASSLLIAADTYNKMGNTEAAIAAGLEGRKLAIETGSWSSIRMAHDVLQDIYSSNGRYKEALNEYKLFKAAHDSMFNSESRAMIAELEAKYKSEEQKRQIELLQRDKKIENLYRSVLIAGLILVIIIMLLLYNRYRIKKRSHEALQKLHESELEAVQANQTMLQMEFDQKKKELDAARELQLSMLPAKIPEHKRILISAYMQTATEVGGDYYDFYNSPDETLTMVIGDATGHGAQAGTMVTATKSLFNLLANNDDIAEILDKISFAIRKLRLPNLFMAMAVVRIKNKTLELAGAGIPPALVFRASSGTVESVSLKGLPLGSFSDHSYTKTSIQLNTGDVVVLMSDGLPELFNSKYEMFGYDKVFQLLNEISDKSPDNIIKQFTKTASDWLNGGKQQDDMTFIVFKVK